MNGSEAQLAVNIGTITILALGDGSFKPVASPSRARDLEFIPCIVSSLEDLALNPLLTAVKSIAILCYESLAAPKQAH